VTRKTLALIQFNKGHLMFFPDLLPSDADRERLEKVCTEFGVFVQDCIGSLTQAFDVAQTEAAKENKFHHATVLLLMRHVIESLDGVSILVAKGCSQPCQPLLRSALEAMLGLFYILEADTERRALAYQLAHAHKKITLYDRLDPTTSAGQELRRVVAPDPCGDLFNSLPIINYPKLIAGLQKMFTRPEFQPIEAEWQRLKAARKNKDPEWYALFGGPQNVRDLAIKVGFPAMYEFLYRYWSNEVHAGSAMEAIGHKDGDSVIRPIRHPEELQSAVTFAAQFSFLLAMKVVGVYAPAKLADLRTRYIDQIQRRSLELARKKVIIAPWKDSSI
jgi:hypothetical protein